MNFCQESIFVIRAIQLNSSTSFLQSSINFCEEKYLRLRTTILDLTGIQTLLAWALHAGIYSSTAVAHRVDGTLVMEARSVGDDLEKRCPQPAVEVTGEFRGPQVAFGTTLGL